MSIEPTSPAAERQAHRARYEALRAAGQGESARALPPLTERGHTLPDHLVLHREHLPGGWYWTTRLARGEALRIVNTAGTSAISMIAWCEADLSERLNTADTMKVQWSTGLRKGRILYTEMGRVALSIIEDTSGAHDPLVGPTTQASMASALGAGVARNSRDNFLAAAAKLGLSRRDVPLCVNFFAPVGIAEDGRFVWRSGQRAPGDFVDLRAEMDLWVVLSNAGHPLDPALCALPEPIDVLRFSAPPPDNNDLCRHACIEAEHAFALTERHVCRGSKS
jgi:urea carboxylase-associated protein 2